MRDESDLSLDEASDTEPDARLSSFYNQGDAADAQPPIPPKPARPDAAVDDAVAAADAYSPGTTVIVTDLETDIQWNGAHGKVIAYDPPTGRYIVELTSAKWNQSGRQLRLSLLPEKVVYDAPISINTAPLVTTSTLPESGRIDTVTTPGGSTSADAVGLDASKGAVDAAVADAPSTDVMRVGQDRGQQVILSHCASVFSRDAWCDASSLLTCLVRVEWVSVPVHLPCCPFSNDPTQPQSQPNPPIPRSRPISSWFPSRRTTTVWRC